MYFPLGAILTLVTGRMVATSLNEVSSLVMYLRGEKSTTWPLVDASDCGMFLLRQFPELGQIGEWELPTPGSDVAGWLELQRIRLNLNPRLDVRSMQERITRMSCILCGMQLRRFMPSTGVVSVNGERVYKYPLFLPADDGMMQGLFDDLTNQLGGVWASSITEANLWKVGKRTRHDIVNRFGQILVRSQHFVPAPLPFEILSMERFHLSDILSLLWRTQVPSAVETPGADTLQAYMAPGTGHEDAVQACGTELLKQFPWIDDPEISVILRGQIYLVQERLNHKERRLAMLGCLLPIISKHGEWFYVAPLAQFS